MIWIFWKRLVCAVLVSVAVIGTCDALTMVASRFDNRHCKMLFVLTTAAIQPLILALPDLFRVHESGRNVWIWWGAFGLLSAILTWRNARQRFVSTLPVAAWAMAAFVAQPVAIPFYVQFGPEGDLWPCHACGRQRVLSLAVCPHCGAQS